jgi:hypothetical protein
MFYFADGTKILPPEPPRQLGNNGYFSALEIRHLCRCT